MEERRPAVLYVHGRGGSAAEAEHYRALFPEQEVIGAAYRAQRPWEIREELAETVARTKAQHGRVELIAVSIGAFCCMDPRIAAQTERAWFVSPIVDMERVIGGLMRSAGITEDELRARGRIAVGDEELDWAFLCALRAAPPAWRVPTQILYGSTDVLQPIETIRAFAARSGAAVTVMPGGEHWFHTAEQMRFLDDWIRRTK